MRKRVSETKGLIGQLITKYFDEIKRSMTWLGEQSDTIFLGQAVSYKGTAMTNTLPDVPDDKKIEMPVCEDLQMGITNGLALEGYVPVSIYPRWNFFVLAANQTINHLDKINLLGEYGVKAISDTHVRGGTIISQGPCKYLNSCMVI